MTSNYYYDAIDLNIQLDASSRLPLLSEDQKILNLIINYLPLPYSATEYGCGKKCSMIINQLHSLGIPSYAIKRGMIMEKDLSPETLAENDYTKRKHALTIENSFYHRADLTNPVLVQLFEESGIKADWKKETIHAGQFVLSNQKTLQFVQARSHIFTILTFWDEKNQCVKERVIDPTIDSDELLLVPQLRKYLQASESLIFTAPLLGEFDPEERYLTEEQSKVYYELLEGREYHELIREEKHELIRRLNSSEKQSIGDPACWTYANNMAVTDQRHHEYQLLNSGQGNSFKSLSRQLAQSRETLNEERVVQLIEEMTKLELRLNLKEVLASDAKWSEEKLSMLTKAVNIISDHIALEELHDRLEKNIPLHHAISQHRGIGMNRLFGISFRLRKRLEELAFVSKNEKGQIDARALSPLYHEALSVCIRQMEDAGLKVFIDQVGNAHGLFLDDATLDKIKQDPSLLCNYTRHALCFGSHIDTVSDGGKYDGRLGVMSGIETANVLHDLQRFYQHNFCYPQTRNTIIVSVFTGEEMNFTGSSVSMPGSAAVSGNAMPEQIYSMHNQYGESYGDQLKHTLSFLFQKQQKKEIQLVNTFNSEKTQLDNCYDPQLFYSSHLLERHIEQGSILHRNRVPLVLVDTIMGIHQQDFLIQGEKAEDSALALNRALRNLTLSSEFNTLRTTCGILKNQLPDEDTTSPIEVDFGMRWKLYGLKNHAGSTLNEDRKDAGVAISRLADYFTDVVESVNQEHGLQLQSIVAAPFFAPGLNRNIIPGEASVSLAIKGTEINPNLINLIRQKCIAFVTGTLALDVNNGGEGILDYKISDINFVNKSEQKSLSLDVRFPEAETKNKYLQAISDLIVQLETHFSVQISTTIEQELNAVKLSDRGQVLQLERSYGGSHNPNETELTRDVLRGSLLQLAVAMEFVHLEHPESINLYQHVKKLVPQQWQNTLPRFVSGALHDTCNIATPLLNEMEE